MKWLYPPRVGASGERTFVGGSNVGLAVARTSKGVGALTACFTENRSEWGLTW